MIISQITSLVNEEIDHRFLDLLGKAKKDPNFKAIWSCSPEDGLSPEQVVERLVRLLAQHTNNWEEIFQIIHYRCKAFHFTGIGSDQLSTICRAVVRADAIEAKEIALGEVQPVPVPEPPTPVSPNQHPRPRGITAFDIVNNSYEARRWIVPNLLPEGFGLLAGTPKAGKSWLALDIARAVAIGGQVLGGIQANTSQVLYIDFESDLVGIQERLGLMGVDGTEAGLENLYFEHSWPSIPQRGLERLNQYLKEYQETRLVIIDTLALFQGEDTGRGNAYTREAQAFAGIRELASKHRVCILAITHTRKSESSRLISSVTGTHGTTGAADVVMILDRIDVNPAAVLSITGRRVRGQKLAIELQEEPVFQWVLSSDEALELNQPKLTPHQELILSALEKVGEKGLSATEVKEALKSDSTREAFQQQLTKLVGLGLIEKAEARGKYRKRITGEPSK